MQVDFPIKVRGIFSYEHSNIALRVNRFHVATGDYKFRVRHLYVKDRNELKPYFEYWRKEETYPPAIMCPGWHVSIAHMIKRRSGETSKSGRFYGEKGYTNNLTDPTDDHFASRLTAGDCMLFEDEARSYSKDRTLAYGLQSHELLDLCEKSIMRAFAYPLVKDQSLFNRQATIWEL